MGITMAENDLKNLKYHYRRVHIELSSDSEPLDAAV